MKRDFAIKLELRLSCGKQASPTECFGAGFKIRELVASGETEDHGARAGLNIFSIQSITSSQEPVTQSIALATAS